MKDLAARGDTSVAEIWRSTKAIERNRKSLDGYLEESKEAYMAAAVGGVKSIAENYPWAFANEQEPEHILVIAGDLQDPENRLRMKRWLVTEFVLSTAEEWAKDIRRGMFGDE